MAVRPNAAARNAIITGGYGVFDDVAITAYDGTQPAAGGGSVGASEVIALGTTTDPAFGAASGGGRGPATFWDLTVEEGVTEETPTWIRLGPGAGGEIIDFSFGEDTEDITVGTGESEVSEGDIIRINAGQLRLPGNDA